MKQSSYRLANTFLRRLAKALSPLPGRVEWNWSNLTRVRAKLLCSASSSTIHCKSQKVICERINGICSLVSLLAFLLCLKSQRMLQNRIIEKNIEKIKAWDGSDCPWEKGEIPKSTRSPKRTSRMTWSTPPTPDTKRAQIDSEIIRTCSSSCIITIRFEVCLFTIEFALFYRIRSRSTPLQRCNELKMQSRSGGASSSLILCKQPPMGLCVDFSLLFIIQTAFHATSLDPEKFPR